MKKKFLAAFMMATVMGMPYCSDDTQEQDLSVSDGVQIEQIIQEVEEPSLMDVSFMAQVTESEISKATLANNDYAFSSEECISVFPSVNPSQHYKFDSKCEENATVAHFTGVMTEGDAKSPKFYAVLPYNEEKNSCVNGKVTVTVPMLQTATPNSFDPTANIMVSVADAEQPAFRFRTVCSFMKIMIDSDYTSLTIKGGDGEVLAGTVSVDPATGESTVTTPHTAIAIKPMAGDKYIARGTYFIAMLPVTFKNKIIVRESSDNVIKEISVNNLAFDRNRYRTVISSVTNNYVVNGVSFKMVSVNGGVFGNETLKDFAVGQTEVTQGLWKAVMDGNNPSSFAGSEDENHDNYPVENVSWDDAQNFITKLNFITGKNFRLLTGAEWEFAARGGNKSQGYTYSGSNNVDDVAWYNGNAGGQTHPVASKRPNELGIYDMSGNVWEWTEEASGSYRVHRGGSWYNDAGNASSSSRRDYSPDRRYDYLGFRLAL